MIQKIAVIDYIGLKGGNHYYSLALLRALARHGHRVCFLSNLSGFSGFEELEYRRIYPVDLKRSFAGLFAWSFGTIRACRFLKSNGYRNVIVHVFESSSINIIFLSILRLFGFQVVGILHDINGFETKEHRFNKSLILNKLLHEIVVHNRFSFNVLKNLKIVRDIDRVKIISHGGHQDFVHQPISREIAASHLGLDAKNEYGLFFGQIKSVKGLDILLEALPTNISNLKLVIAGKPWKDDMLRYRKIIRNRGLEDVVIEKIGFVNEEERDLLFQMASFIVLPYREIYQSGVLLMAMSYGLPIILSDLEPNREIAGNGETLLFKTGSVPELRKAILELCQNSALRISLSEKSLLTIQNKHNWGSIAQEFERLFNRENEIY